MFDYTEWQLAEAAITNARQGVLLYGPPATGKSYLARTYQAPVVVIPMTCTEGMTDSKLIGHYIQTDNGFAWHNGPLVDAWSKGGRLILDEIDKLAATPETGAEGALYGILDSVKSASMQLVSGEIVSPHPSFRCIATSNEPPDVLPEAIVSRFPIVVPINSVHPAALESLSPDLRNLASVLTVAKIASDRIDFRKWQEFDYIRGNGTDADLAAMLCFGLDRAEQVIDALAMASSDES